MVGSGQAVAYDEPITTQGTFAGIVTDQLIRNRALFLRCVVRTMALFSDKPTAKKQPAQAQIGRISPEDGERLQASGEYLNLSAYGKSAGILFISRAREEWFSAFRVLFSGNQRGRSHDVVRFSEGYAHP